MSQFKLIEVKSETGKDYYIEGYVSTTKPDFVNDIVDEQGQRATNREINNSDITMDEDHSEWRHPKTGKMYDGKKDKYPLAKVMTSHLDSVGTWVKAKLNRDHPEFEARILPMIKEGFLHSFSIAYKVTKSFNKIVNNVKYRVIQDLGISNIGITGNPVNKDATFSMALKSFPKMVEEKIKQMETQIAELTSTNEVLTSENVQLKSTNEDLSKARDEETSKEDVKKDEKDGMEMKSLFDKVTSLETSVEKLNKENAELKSFVESPQLKSIVEGKSKAPEDKPEKVDAWSVM